MEHGSHDELLRIDKEYANLVKNSFVNSNDVELEDKEYVRTLITQFHFNFDEQIFGQIKQ